MKIGSGIVPLFREDKIGYLFARVKRSLRSRYKSFRVHQRARLKQYRSQLIDLGNPQAVIWIFGCQRSGTTFLERIFRHDLNSAVFGEFSQLTIGERKTVLSKAETIRQLVESQNAQYAVIRSLFESDRAAELLDLFPNSTGIWLFRDSPHVVDSMRRKWGARFFEISKNVESNEDGVWRLEQTVESICAAAQNAIPEDPLAESYARYWLARNQLPLRNGLQRDSRMVFVSYRQLVRSPRTEVDRIMKQAGLAGVWKGFRANAYTSSIDRPVQVNITEETIARCDQIYQQLVEYSKSDLRDRA